MRCGFSAAAAASASSIVSPGMNADTDFRMNARLVACSRSHGDVDIASSTFRIRDIVDSLDVVEAQATSGVASSEPFTARS